MDITVGSGYVLLVLFIYPKIISFSI